MTLWRRKTARAYVFDADKKLFLTVKSSLPPFGLHLPGGGIDRGETVEEAVKRELKEELSILPENIISITFVGNRKSWNLCIPHSDDLFLIVVKNLQLKLSWEISKIYWKTPEEIKSCGKADIVNLKLSVMMRSLNGGIVFICQSDLILGSIKFGMPSFL